MHIAVFPKCYLEDIARKRTMTVFEWIEIARQLVDAEGLEMYEGFFDSMHDDYIDSVTEAIHKAGFVMPMLCCSPDLTNPDATQRQRAIEYEAEMIRITRRMGGPKAVCRVLTGQRYPQVTLEQGLEWVAEALTQLIPVARDYDIILGLENHYKDGHWKYPEFAQKQAIFLQVLDAVSEQAYFGVQYDPSNAIVAGDDPLDLLRRVANRVVSMHASDRYLVEGKTLDDMRQNDGTLGYSPYLVHGVTGQGLNDYDAIFSILSKIGFDGWISIEDGMNGLAEMQQSLTFLGKMRDKYFETV
jgi:sugar phosphate isomerase/epimerase